MGRLLARLRYLLMAIVGVLCAPALFAVDIDGIEFRCEPLFPNSSPPGGWWPIRIALENTGPRERRVEVRVLTEVGDNHGTVEWSVELSPGATKRDIVPAFQERREYGWSRVHVELRENGEELHREPLGMPGRQQRGAVVAIVPTSAEVGDLTVRELGAAVTSYCPFTTLTREEIPSRREVFAGTAVIVFFGVGPEELSAPQRDAVRAAIRAGARGLVVPGASGEGNGWLTTGDQLQPVRWTDSQGTPRTSFLRESEELSNAPELREEADGLGVWVVRTRLAPPDQSQWWRLAIGHGEQPAVPGTELPRQLQQIRWLHDLDRAYRRTVPVELVFLFVGIYVLVVGPGLFWYLRRKERLVWLLWLQPLVVVLFLVLVYVVGYLSYGIPAQRYQTLLLALEAEGESDWADGRVILSQYSSVAGEREVVCDDGSLPVHRYLDRSERRPQQWRLDDAGGRLSSFFFRNWSLTHFATDGPIYTGGGTLAVTVQREAGIVISARVRNELGFPIRSVYLRGSRHLEAGEIAPGEEVELTAHSLGSNVPNDDPQWNEVKRRLVGQHFNLIAEFDPADLPEPVRFGYSDADTSRGLLVLRTAGVSGR